MLLLWISQMAVTNDHCQSSGLEVMHLLLGFKMSVKGVSLCKHACVHACVLTYTDTRVHPHTGTWDCVCTQTHYFSGSYGADTVISKQTSPFLPLHQGCRFRQEDLVAHQHLELQRVLGDPGDQEGPGRKKGHWTRQDVCTLPQNVNQGSPTGPRWPSHLPSGPRLLSHPSLLEVLANPVDRKLVRCYSVRDAHGSHECHGHDRHCSDCHSHDAS